MLPRDPALCPQFVGPPWHVMPLHRDVDWAGMGVFINITSDTPWLVANETAGGWQSQRSIEQQLRAGRQTAGVAGVQVNLPDLRAAYNFLRWVQQPASGVAPCWHWRHLPT